VQGNTASFIERAILYVGIVFYLPVVRSITIAGAERVTNVPKGVAAAALRGSIWISMRCGRTSWQLEWRREFAGPNTKQKC
jgi:hypothetical protein